MLTVSSILRSLEEKGYSCNIECYDNFEIIKYSSLSNLSDYSITWAKSAENIEKISFNGKKNILVLCPMDIDIAYENVAFVKVNNPKAAFFSIVEEFFTEKRKATISQHAAVETTDIGENVSIGSFTYIASDVVIGDNVTIGNNVSIECRTIIGDGSTIGSGTVIGTCGYGYYSDNDGINRRVPHTGGVFIGKNVDIGANVCIDRGTIEDTVIEDNVKIDNLCHIAHNVKIEKNAMVIALSLLAGSVTIGENAYIAPGALIMNQKTIGKDSLVGMGSVVLKDVPENKVVLGVPAKVIRDNKT